MLDGRYYPMGVFTPVYPMHFPNVTVKCQSNDKPWINKKIKALIQSCQQASSTGNVTVYKKLCNQVKHAMLLTECVIYKLLSPVSGIKRSIP